MNKSYRIVWNKARNCLMVVAEFASSQGKGKSVGGAVIGAVAAAVMALGAAGDAEATSSSTQVIVSGPGSNLDVLQTDAITVSGATAVWGTGSVGSISVTGTVTGQPAGISIGGTPTNFSFGSNIEIGVMSTGPATTYTGTVSGSQTGISLRTTYLNSGSIINKGLINGTGVVGVLVSVSTIVGSILNQTQAATAGYPAAAGTIRGATGVLITNGSTVSPSPVGSTGISNAGLIQGTSLAGVSIAGSQVNTIINQTGGTISGQWGLKITDGAKIVGNISNAGALLGDVNTGNAALLLNASTITGDVLNSGRVFAQGAVELINTQITGAFTNTGTIDSYGAPVAGDAINLQGSNVLNGFNNTSLIRGAQSGIQIVGSTIAGGFNNTGNIQGNAGAGVAMTNSTLSGGFTSSGTITGLSGVRLVDSTTAGAITNTGVIAATATSGSAISVSGGVKATLANVAGTVIGALNGNMDVSNSGLIALQQASGTNTVTGSHVNATISGNYVQAAAGMLQIGVTGTTGTGTTSGNFSILNVVGSATFAANSKLRVNLNQAGAVFIGQTLSGVVAATSLSTNGFTITDNLAGINFTYATTAGSLSLIATAATVNCGATVSGNNLGTCEVAINNPNLYIDPTGKVGTTSGAINGIGIAVLSGNIAGRIYNRGTIVGSTSAIHFTSGATLTGGLTNAGLINGVSGTAISMAPGVLGGGLTNQRGGTIQGVLDAITLNQTSIAGGLNNSGLISGAFTAINANGATISGGLNNSIGGVISAPVAIQAINSNISGINNSGFIVGAGNTGTAITASGTTVTLNNAQYGQVYGGLQGTLDISNSGVIALQSVSGLSMVAGSHFNGSIAGNFVESGTGALILGVAGTAGSGTTAGNFSVLTVGGTVSLASGSKVKLDLSSTTAITAGETISNLITAAGGLTDNGVQIIGNSAKLDFTAITTTGGLSAAAQLRDANSYANLLSSVTSTVTSYLAFDNPNLSINSATINGVAKGVVVLSAGPANVGRLVNFGVIRANYTGVYLSSGSTVTGGITNTGQIGGTSVAGIAMNAALLQSGINVNAGTIAGGVAGIQVVHSSIAGGVTNSIGATITGGSYGIQLQSSTLVGGIANSGLLRGSSVAGLAIMASTLAGGVTNASNRTITGLTGIGIIAGSTVSGNVANSGLIQGSTLAGSAGIAITGSLLSNNLTNNSGATVTGYSGVWLGANAAINGALNNVGQVVGLGGAALSVSGAVNVAGNVGNSGTLRGQTGINLSAATLTGAITNTGLIQGTGTGLLATGSTLNNTIYNTGSIGGQSGIRLANSTIAGSLSNTGVISGARAAVSLTGGVSIATLNNSGTFVGAAGLQLGNAVVSGSINNTGLMSGGSVGAGVSVAGSTLVANFANSGTLSGQSGMNLANSTISGAFSNTGLISGVGAGLSIAGGLNVAGSFINNGTITGTANAINLANATVVGAITNAGLIYAASNNAITASGGTNSTILNATGGTIVGALNGALNISNSGLVSLTSFGGTVGSHLAASIAGNYLQDGTSTLVLGVNGVSGSGTVSGNYSSLTAGQMILNGSTISVQQNRGNAVYQGQTLANVLVASSGITPNNISIVDDIKSIYYTLSGSGNAYSLVAMAVGSNCTTPLNSAFIGSCQITTTNPNLTVGASGGVYGGQNAGVYVISGAINGRLVNAGTISSNQTGIFFTSGANLQGGVTNTGLIQATLGGYGILMTASGMASLQNQSGTISGVSAGVKLSYSSITGGLTNTGLIGGGIGLLLSNSFISGGLYNAGYMNDVSISGSTAVGLVFNTTSGTVGGYFASNSLISGDVSNSGLITNGILIRQSTISGNFVQNAALGTQTTHARSGLIFDRSNVTGSIINSGTVSTPQGYFGTGIALYGSTVGGSVVNTGQLDAFYGRGISIGGTYIAGGLTNTGSVFSSELTVQISGSTIASGIYNTGHINSGFLIQSASHINNGLVNTGYIGNYGPVTLRNSTITGGVLNALSGTMAGGFRSENSYVDSGITNQGFVALLHIGSLNSTGSVVAGGSVAGGINNSGLIQNSSGHALQVVRADVSAGITNTGSIIASTSGRGGGARIYSSNITGGIRNSGYIYGSVNPSWSPASTYGIAVSASTISSGINNVTGTIVGGVTGVKIQASQVNGGIFNTGLISGLNGVAMVATGLPSTLTVQNAQSGLIVGGVSGDFEVSNSGVLALQTLSGIGGAITAGSHVNATIAGNYIQSGTGALRIGATGSTAGSYSQMNVSSIASFAPGGQIIVNTNNLNAFNGGDTLNVVSVSGASSLTVSGLSIVDNTPYVSFDWATVGGSLNLIAYSTAACGSVTGNIIASCEVSTVNGGTAASNYTFVNVFSGGTISPNTASSRVYAPAISVISGAAVNGYINNAGLVLSNNTGILFNSGSNLQGGVTNTGLVIGTVAAGFAMTAGILQGGLSNAGGTFSGGQSGFNLVNASISGGVTNTGLIQGLTNAGVAMYSTLIDSFRNTGGTIVGNNIGMVLSNSTITGGFSNTGLIKGSVAGVMLGAGTNVTLSNLAGGSIVGVTGAGVSVSGATSSNINNLGYINSVNNAGSLVSLNNVGTVGALVQAAGVLSGVTNSGLLNGVTAVGVTGGALSSLTNTGSISGSSVGVAIASAGTLAGLNNQALISSINNAGLLSTLVNSGSLASLVNSGSVSSVTNTASLTTLANTGTISAVNNTGGTITGLTSSGAITAVNNSGIINGISLGANSQVANGITNAGLIGGAAVAITASGSAVTLINQAAGTVVGAINGTANVSNSGLIALQSAYNGSTFAGSPVSATITGNYVQAASGILQLGVTSSGSGSGTTSGNYSNLGVGGSASFAANSNINVIMSSTNSVIAGQTLAGVVSATGGLSSAGFSIIDNSTLVDFVWRTTSGSLMLVAVSQSVTCAATITGAQQGACEVGLGLPNLTITSLGTISGASQGIKVLSATSTAIMNQGSVLGSVTAIQFLANGTLTGGITNAGLISGASGIVLGAGAYAQSITNTTSGSIVGSAGAGISVAGTASVGQIQNNGYISSISVSGSIASGINNQGGTINLVNLVGAHVNGGLTNTGVLGSGNTGLWVSTSVLTGGVVNSGRMAGVIFNGSTLIGDIVNSASGTISSGAMSLWVNNSSVSGSILNAGRIVTTSYAGLDVSNSTVFGVVNSAGGLISGYEGLLVNNSTINSVISNAGGASIVGSNGVGITVGGTSNVAGISNAGFITSIVNSARISGAVTAVRVVTGGLVSGGLTNSGSIAGTGVSGLGVLVSGGTIGGISNSGYISNIKLTNTGLISGINNAGGSIGGIIAMSGSISSGVTNSGTVSGYRAISLGANSYLSGGLNNTGRLQGDSAVLMIGATSSVSGGLRNAGQIVGRTGVSLFSSALVGGITNTGSIVGASGTLTGYGVLVSASALDVLTNTGLIQGQQAIVLDSTTVTGVYNTGSILGSTVGLTVSGDSQLGSISNTGYITSINNAGSMGGIVFSNAGITDYIVNTGTVTAAVNQAIAIRGGSSVSSGITNAGILTGDTGAGVLIGQSSVESFTNQISGTVSGLLNGLNLNIGAVLSSNLSNAGLLQGTSVAGLRIEASTILGGINNTGSMIGSGTGTSTGLLIIAGSTVSSGVTNSGLLGGAIGVRVDNSSVSAIQNTGLISGGSGVAITASGAALTLNNAAAGSIVGAVNGTVDVSNSGLIALQSAYNGSSFAGSPVSTTITGNYVQAASGTLQLGVTSSGAGTGTTSGNYSTLSLTGSASFAASSVINVVMSSADSVVAGQTLAGVVSAGSLTSNGFSILDNSALIGFRYQTVSGVLNLVAFNTPNCGSVVGTAQVGPCEVGVGIPSMTVTGLGTISGGTQGINVLAANLTGRIINQGTVQGTATAIRFAAGGTLSGGITNSGLIEGLGYAAVVINGASVGGVANNSGTIAAAGRGINAINGAVIGGGITNTGLIANTSATATGAAAVVIDAATLVGGLLNTGNITSSGSALQLANNAQLQGGLTNTGSLIGGGNAGLYITGFSTLSGLVNNSGYFAGISLKSSGLIANGINNTGVVSLATAISIANNSTIAGGITNSGTIHGNGNYGISLGRTSALVGGVNNLVGGTISGAMTAISLSRYSVISAITNSGLISGSNAFGAAIGLSRSTITAGIANTGSIVSAGAYAITLDALSRVNGGVTNSGYISGVRNAGYLGGLSNFTGVITGGINNTGTIERDQLAVFMYHGTLTGGFTNSGVIQATSSFAGMQLYASNLTGDLANIGGTILGGLGGSAALSLISSSLVTGVLSNTGMISGQVGVDLYASQVAGGISNSGSIVGTSGAGVEVGANTTLSGLNNTGYISSVSNAGFIATINNVGGTIADGVTNSGLIYNASGSSITASGSTLTFANIAGGTLAGQFGGDLSISNSGLIALQTMAGGTISAGTSLSASITGNYVQATSGTLQFGVNGVSGTGTIAGNYSTLSVSGSATFAANSKLKVSMSSTTAVQNGQTLAGVLTAGSLTTNGFSITDNSALVDFTYATVGGVLSLIATAPVTVACGTVSSSVQGPCLMAFNAPNVLVTGLGTISGGTTGIRVLSGSIVGGIVNQGSVIGTSYGVAVNQGATTITGSLSNAGLIQGGGVGAGVLVSASNLAGGLNNATSGTIAGYQGVNLAVGATLSGGLTNSGLIHSTAVSPRVAVQLTSSMIAGGLNNLGGSIAGRTGVSLHQSTITGGLANSGVINGFAGGGVILLSSSLQSGINNQSAGTVTGLLIGLSLSASTLSGGITNTGLITGTLAGVYLGASSVLQNGLNNNGGTISSAASGVVLTQSTLTGGLTNSGLITGLSGAGLNLSASGLAGVVNNLASGTIAGVTHGLQLSSSVLNGNLNNAGLITGTSFAGVFVLNSSITGSVLNTGGTISGAAQGMRVNSSTLAGGISNSGLITGSVVGLSLANANMSNGIANLSGGSIGGVYTGVFVSGSQISGGVSNATNATISATVGTALAVLATSTISAGITNSGLITGGAGARGVSVHFASTINGGLSNTSLATISGGASGLAVTSNSVINGGLTNAGLITGSTGVGIAVTGASTIAGSLLNLALATISGGVTGLSVSANSLVSGGLTNAGLITGGTYAINAPGLTSIVSTGTASQFVGTVSAASAALAVANGSTLTAGSPMVLGSVNVANGAQMNLTSSPTATVSGGVIVTNGFTNAGVLNVGQSAATITGSYTQTSLGNLFVPVVGSNGSGSAAGAYGQLHVTGAANFAANTTITVSMNAQNSVLGGGTLAGVVTAGTLTTNGFTIVDNSALVNFVWSTVGGTLSLIAVANANVCGATISGAQAGPCQVAYNNPNLTVTSLGSITGGAQGAQVLSGLITGHIANQGLISGSQTGVQFAVGSTLSGGLTNSGLITGSSLAGVVMSGTLLQGGLNNLGGSITGGVTGLQMGASTIAGGISNTGYIQGLGGSGIALTNASVISGGLNNVANATISGGMTGLSVSVNSVVSGGLTNAGLITGGTYAINAPGLTSIVSTGTASQFVGTVSAVNATLLVASGSTMTAAQGISVSALTVGAGSTLNLVSIPTATTSGGVSVTNGMTNAGVVNVGRSVATVTGNYTQATTGSLAFAGNGRLLVTGVANFGSNTQIQAPTTSFTTSSFLNGNSTTVITVAGTLLTNGFNVTGGTPVIGYQAAVNGNSVNLVAQANNLQTIVSSQGNTAGVGAAGALNSVLAGFVNGASNAMTPVAATFANMTSNAQVSQAVSQSLPVLSSNSPVQTLAVLNAINQSIEARSLKLRGVSSGHEMYGSNTVWMKPFGSWMNQGNMNGAYGFKANAGGLMLGADHQWDDKARVGGAFAWGNSSANSNMGGQNQTSNMYQFVGYGAYAVTPSVNVNLQANGGWNNNTTNRNIGFLGTSAQASYDSAVWHAGVGVDRPTKLSEDTTFIPQARFDYTWIRNQGYSETGAAYGMGLNVGSQTYQTSVLGVDGKVQHKIGDHHMVSTNLGVGYNFSPTQTWVAASYQGASALQFTTTGVNPSAVSGRAGLGYTYKVKEGVDVGVRYDIDVQSQYTNQIATAKARWNF